jgi:hypothetical protein
MGRGWNIFSHIARDQDTPRIDGESPTAAFAEPDARASSGQDGCSS